ncbi:MAG: hypothetical protein WB799_00170 [Candidatus Sulfotelmatobacter sp.]
MKLVGIIGTAVLSLTLAAPVYAQQEQHDQPEEQKAKPQDEKKAQPEKPAKQEEKNAKPEEKNAHQEKSAKPEEKNAKQEPQRAPEAKPEKQEQHASNGRIPDDRYKANFGREHTFRVSQNDFRSGRFQYGGYWFGFGGAWPSNWLYTQNVYVIEINGMYYLCNPMYPGVNLAISVTL